MNLTAQDDKSLVEQVVISNIEVPVRVLDKDHNPVADLGKGDFQIFENGQPMKINGFYLKRKRIREAVTLPVRKLTEPTQQAVPRTFVLAFQLTDYTDEIGKAIDHLFDNVLKKGDRVLVFYRQNTLDLTVMAPEEMGDFKKKLKTDLRQECKLVKMKAAGLIRMIEESVKINWAVGEASFNVPRFLMIWKQYKQKYILPDTTTFYRLAQFLNTLKGHKWVFSFYQLEQFPKLKRESTAYINMFTPGNQDQFDYLKAFELSDDEFPVEEISKLFSKVDTTFHSFYLRRFRDQSGQDLQYEAISEELERTLIAVTKLTGGQNIASNKLTESIEKVVELEDAYYMLTYAPVDINKSGKIRVKVNREGVKLFYDDQFRADYIKPRLAQIEAEMKSQQLRIISFEAGAEGISFQLSGCLGVDGKGQITLRVRLLLGEGTVCLDEEKKLQPDQNTISLRLPVFAGLPAGEYRVVIDASNEANGQRDTLYRSVTLSGS